MLLVTSILNTLISGTRGFLLSSSVLSGTDVDGSLLDAIPFSLVWNVSGSRWNMLQLILGLILFPQ